VQKGNKKGLSSEGRGKFGGGRSGGTIPSDVLKKEGHRSAQMGDHRRSREKKTTKEGIAKREIRSWRREKVTLTGEKKGRKKRE